MPKCRFGFIFLGFSEYLNLRVSFPSVANVQPFFAPFFFSLSSPTPHPYRFSALPESPMLWMCQAFWYCTTCPEALLIFFSLLFLWCSVNYFFYFVYKFIDSFCWPCCSGDWIQSPHTVLHSQPFLFLFWNSVLLNCLGRTWPFSAPATVSWVLGL